MGIRPTPVGNLLNDMTYNRKLHGLPRSISADLTFFFGSGFSLLLALTLLRILLLMRNAELAASVPIADILRSFAIGARFDTMIVAYACLPMALAVALPKGIRPRGLFLGWMIVVSSVLMFLGVLELDFYHEFHARLNGLVFQYLREDPGTVLSMVWHGFPVVRYLGLWLLLSVLVWTLYRYVAAHSDDAHTPADKTAGYTTRFVVFLVLSGLVYAGGRGTLRSGPPLRWGDAYRSTHVFANHLALNGVFTLVKAWAGEGREKERDRWLTALPEKQALGVARDLLVQPGDDPIETARYAVLRRHTPAAFPSAAPIANIVVILMESFSAEFVGALGHDFGITPAFDRLAQEGLLFDHFFSNGTHTHQGMFASLACFPNLPGFEYLMQQPEGTHRFSGLAAILQKRDYKDLYVYNGDFSWDNQEGFFRNQGMRRFIGRGEYVAPKFTDPTWGVSDEDMFARAAEELSKLPAGTPFFAVLQSLSNHTPFAIPDPLPVSPVTGHGHLNEHLTAMKYSDWALGRFFAEIRSAPFFKRTLFVVVGDHGFGVPNQVTSIDLLRFHVPALLIGPGIREAYGTRRSTVATQVDLVPTAVARLGAPFVHQCWGRDILALTEDDAGFGMIKPSGGDKTEAFIQGNRVLVRSPQSDDTLFEYALYPTATAREMPGTGLENELSINLDGYVQAAMRSLVDNKAGLNDGA